MYWKIFKPKTFGVKALILCDNEVLLVKCMSYSMWHMPGGGIHKNEDSVSAILRELNEELHLKIKLSDSDKSKIVINNNDEQLATINILGTYQSSKEGKRDTIYVYVIELKTKLNFEINTNELTDAAWIRMSDIIDTDEYFDRISPATLRRISEYQSGVKFKDIRNW